MNTNNNSTQQYSIVRNLVLYNLNENNCYCLFIMLFMKRNMEKNQENPMNLDRQSVWVFQRKDKELQKLSLYFVIKFC